MAPPFTDAEFDIMYGEGISKPGDLIDVGVEAGIIDKSGSWYSYSGERIGQGRENVKKFLKDNPDLYESMYLKAREALGLSGQAKAETENEDKQEKKARGGETNDR
jgi:recombination protein RecA